MNRVNLAITVFFGTAILLYWQVQSKRGDAELTIDPQSRPDYIVDDIKSVAYNELGLVSNRLSAKHMEHYQDNNITLFTEPIYLIYPEKGQAQWQVQSGKGTMNKKSGKVILEDNVIINAIDTKEPIQTVTTSYLELDLNTRIMVSDRKVYITGSDFIIEGLGLYGDLNAESVKLTSQVHGTYEPE